MEPLFLGGHPAADFLNTSFEPDGEHIETIGDGRAFIAWLVAAELIDEAQGAKMSRRLGVKGADAAAADARKLREWARGWLERWRKSPNAGYEEELETLNAYLSRESLRREVVAGKEGLQLRSHAQLDDSDAILGLLAATIAALVTEEEPSLLRTCAGPACTLWFLDRTKAHRRLFCSAATCGNRAKVAAFRERQKE